MNKKKLILIVCIVIAFVALIVLQFYTVKKSDLNADLVLDKNTISTSTLISDISSGINTTNQISSTKKIEMKMPALDRQIIYSKDYTDEAKKLLAIKINDAILKIKADSSNADNWIYLGQLRKMGTDYVGSAEAWEYAGYLLPKGTVPFLNLADLYAYYIKDNVKAEKNFLKAIENGPEQSTVYMRFADFYKDVFNDKEKARNIILLGLSKNPDDTDLIGYLKYMSGDKSPTPESTQDLGEMIINL